MKTGLLETYLRARIKRRGSLLPTPAPAASPISAPTLAPATPFPAIRHVSRNRDLGAKLDRAPRRSRIDRLGLARNLSRSLTRAET